MSDIDLLRCAVVACCIALMPIGMYHRIRAHTGERLDRWQEGAVILFGLRLSALMLFVACILWLNVPRWMAWSELPIPFWLRWTGLGVSVTGGALFVWTVHTLGKNLTDTVVTRIDSSLVTNGPYRWVRHPFYTACGILLIGAALVTANWFIGLLSGLTWIVFLVIRTRIEERKLVERFGDDYRSYMLRTGRFLPRLW